MEPKYTSFQHKSRYYVSHEIGNATRDVLFVMHGHGQLAQFFIRKFSSLDDSTVVIAPEGQSRYYLEGFSGRVGATWMTKEDRLTDIENYVAYLNKVYEEVMTSHDPAKYRITFLGFSQGAATVSRWATNCIGRFDRLILWAGIFPPDLDVSEASEVFKSKELISVYGTEDPYVNDKRMLEMKDISKSLGVQPESFSFKGGHDIDPELLKTLFS